MQYIVESAQRLAPGVPGTTHVKTALVVWMLKSIVSLLNIPGSMGLKGTGKGASSLPKRKIGKAGCYGNSAIFAGVLAQEL